MTDSYIFIYCITTASYILIYYKQYESPVKIQVGIE